MAATSRAHAGSGWEVGASWDFGAQLVQLLQSVTRGRVYDLSSGWWPGMPLAEGHPAFQVMTFRTPRGERNQGDLAFLRDNRVNFGFISDLLMMTTHTGTHIDSLAHIVCGPDSAWYGGHSANDELGDFGPLRDDARDLPPLFARGVMLDLPAALGRDTLRRNEAIGSAELDTAASAAGVALEPGDVLLLRTGTMHFWPDTSAMAALDGCGLSLEGAEWLLAHRPAAIGGDTGALEVAPSGLPGDPQPVHRRVIQESGVPIMEWVNTEALAREGVHEFVFIALPLPITGATGSPIRPVAVV